MSLAPDILSRPLPLTSARSRSSGNSVSCGARASSSVRFPPHGSIRRRHNSPSVAHRHPAPPFPRLRAARSRSQRSHSLRRPSPSTAPPFPHLGAARSCGPILSRRHRRKQLRPSLSRGSIRRRHNSPSVAHRHPAPPFPRLRAARSRCCRQHFLRRPSPSCRCHPPPPLPFLASAPPEAAAGAATPSVARRHPPPLPFLTSAPLEAAAPS
ncbi:hypothetical protein SEVIR_9G283142v4 [Setaria viridis]